MKTVSCFGFLSREMLFDRKRLHFLQAIPCGQRNKPVRTKSESGQRAHNQNGPFNAYRVEVFLPYEAVVDRLEGAAKQLDGASVLHRGGLAILKLGAGSTSGDSDSRPEVWL